MGDGAAYDPRRRRWRRIADAPAPRDDVQAVWTGNQVLVWGGARAGSDSRGVLAYDPETDGWRRYPPPPVAVGLHAVVVWTGRALLVWGGTVDGPPSDRGALLDTRDGTWRVLPDAGLRGRVNPAYGLVEGCVVVWGGVTANGPAGDGRCYDVRVGRWRAVTTSLGPRVPGGVATTEDGVLVWSGWDPRRRPLDDGGLVQPVG